MSGCSQLTVDTLESLKKLKLTTLSLPNKITSRVHKEITLQSKQWEESIENLNKDNLKPSEKISSIEKETSLLEEKIYLLFQEKVNALIREAKTNVENKEEELENQNKKFLQLEKEKNKEILDLKTNFDKIKQEKEELLKIVNSYKKLNIQEEKEKKIENISVIENKGMNKKLPDLSRLYSSF